MAFQYKWRVAARVVAYLSLIGTIISALMYATQYVCVLTNNISEDSFLLDLDFYGFKIKLDDAQWTIYLRAVLSTITLVLYLWTSILLLGATKVEADPVQGLESTNFWLILVVLDSILWIIGMTYNGLIVPHPEESEDATLEYIFTLIFFVAITGVVLFIVLKFAREMKQAVRGVLPTTVTCKF